MFSKADPFDHSSGGGMFLLRVTGNSCYFGSFITAVSARTHRGQAGQSVDKLGGSSRAADSGTECYRVTILESNNVTECQCYRVTVLPSDSVIVEQFDRVKE